MARALNLFGLATKLELKQARGHGKRAYAAGQFGRLMSDWIVAAMSIDGDIRNNIFQVRERARDINKNNPLGKRYIDLGITNIPGPFGFTLKNQAKEPDGTLDTLANNALQDAWRDFFRRGNFSVNGRFSGVRAQWVLTKYGLRDGEAFLHIVTNPKNFKYGIKVQLIPPDAIDERKNDEHLPNGNSIRLGVEMDQQRTPVAYWVRQDPVGALYQSYNVETASIRIPASEMLHWIPDHDYADQSRGMSTMASVMVQLKDLLGSDKAALLAARIGASNMGFVSPHLDNPLTPESDMQDEDDDAEMDVSIVKSAEPGSVEVLPAGATFQSWDTKYPNTQYDPFTVAMIRRIASGLNVAYSSLSSDYSLTSYSSSRQELKTERDTWKMHQESFVEAILEPLFAVWLQYTLALGRVQVGRGPLPLAKYDKFNQPYFVGRRWDWVDPLKDMAANVLAMQAGLTSATHIAAENGDDIEDIYRELGHEKELRAKYNILTKVDEIKVLGSGGAESAINADPSKDPNARARAEDAESEAIDRGLLGQIETMLNSRNGHKYKIEVS